MTREELYATFNENSESTGRTEFDKIENPRHPRCDLCAFMILHDLVKMRYPGADMICCAKHDQIWLDVDLDELAGNITPEIVRDLVRCGVWLDTETDSLSLFV